MFFISLESWVNMLQVSCCKILFLCTYARDTGWRRTRVFWLSGGQGRSCPGPGPWACFYSHHPFCFCTPLIHILLFFIFSCYFYIFDFYYFFLNIKKSQKYFLNFLHFILLFLLFFWHKNSLLGLIEFIFLNKLVNNIKILEYFVLLFIHLK